MLHRRDVLKEFDQLLLNWRLAILASWKKPLRNKVFKLVLPMKTEIKHVIKRIFMICDVRFSFFYKLYTTQWKEISYTTTKNKNSYIYTQ